MKKELTVEIISGILIILFVYTASSKLFDYSTFQFQLRQSPFLDGKRAGIVAFAVPIMELLLAFSLIFPNSRLMGLYGSFFLLTLFTAYIIVMLNSGFDIPCSCGGVLENLSWSQHIAFNSAFWILSIIGISLEGERKETRIPTPR